MRKIELLTALLIIILTSKSYGQSPVKAIDSNPENWTVFNRNVTFNGDEIYLNAQENDGILWLKEYNFKNGTIELDIKGRDVQGQSFVGIAFYGTDDNAFEGIYFRPFNFQSPERRTHSVQYISMPDNDWSRLRSAFPDKYESAIQLAPNPNEWFHVKIVVDSPKLKVYVNAATSPTLEINQISDRTQGKFGLWVGNGSDGYFKNVSISPK